MPVSMFTLIATRGFFSGGTKQERLKRLNEHLRRISRIVIDPRYRGLGLASRLVRETMFKLDVAMVETTAVMGGLNGFLERAGMRRFDLPPRPQAAALARTLKEARIDETLWIDARAVQKKIESLSARWRTLVEKQIHRFMGAYGNRRTMPAGAERTRFALSRLCAKPVYYAWLNPQKPVQGLRIKKP